MTIFLVERDLTGMTMPGLAASQKAVIAKGREMTVSGKPVRYVRSVFVPSDHRCLCLFESETKEDVEQANKEVEFPFTSVTEALDLMTWSASWPPL